MGGCCSSDIHGRRRSGGYFGNDFDEKEYYDEDEEDEMRYGDSGARIRLKGSSSHTSMHTQQGRKGINQDAMTIWESFTGENEMFLCGVFDGHGPYGHKVARHVRDNLPSKLSKAVELSRLNTLKYGNFDLIGKALTSSEDDDHDVQGGYQSAGSENQGRDDHGNGNKAENEEEEAARILPLSSWEACFIKSFKEMDEELGLDPSIDSFCSGSTAVTVVKQGDNLIIANLGDSRAILCSRGYKNQLIPIQLTVDLKPDIASEAERIRCCKGRVFAADEEPDVYRLWMPDEDCPGLAMARAFGDFCLKDYGLISIPDVSYRRLTSSDEFVVLATDGVWDALTNIEVVTIVSSARKRSTAARILVNRAVRAWKIKYPGCKVDDCAAVCLFFKDAQPIVSKSSSQLSREGSGVGGSNYHSFSRSIKSYRCNNSIARSEASEHSSQWDQWNALQGISRVNSMVKLPRFLSFRRSASGFHEVESH